ncbi:MAG TPA: type II secretion system secretin GspD [Stellaceae bacterium]|nr:type II secretion system secretin GspD [Stellaceae bacterium]
MADAQPQSGAVLGPPSATVPAPRADQIIRGSGVFVGHEPPARPGLETDDSDGITLNFVNADVAEVAKAVLGDFLKLNYVVDASVKGAVTLQTTHPLPRDSVLPALEEAFRISGLALLRSGDVWRIVPMADAPRQAGIVRPGGQAGFGVEIVPLQYVGAGEMQRMLEPLSPAGAVLRADTARNLLVIAGTSEERRDLTDNIRVFDVDWMKGMSFGVFPLRSADAKAVAGELAQIIGTKDGPLAGVVHLTAIERMNALLAISTQPRYLDALRTWIDRLDQAQASNDQHLYVYYVQNGRAKDLAAVLAKALGAEGGEQATAGGPSSAPTTGPQLPAVPEAVLSQLSGGGGPPHEAAPQPDDALGGLSAASQGHKQGMRITADEVNNALLVVATPTEYEMVQSALGKLDIAPLQIMLEAAVAEVDLTDQLNYGIQFYLQSGPGNQIFRTSGASPIPAPTVPGFNYILSSGNDIRATLSALDAITHVTVLSAPDVLVLNNQTATLQVGDQVPISTQSAVSVTAANAPVVNSIEYRDTGIILKVTPRVNEGGLVMMDVAQEVSDVSTTTTSTLNSPTISERKIDSTIAVHDGETVALGGLIKDSRSRGRSGIPVLQDIPYVGALFGDNSESVKRTELLVLITPHVVQGDQKLRAVTEEMKRKMPATLPVLTLPALKPGT